MSSPTLWMPAARSGTVSPLRSSSVIQTISYEPTSITYRTFDEASQELLRCAFTPTTVTAGAVELPRLSSRDELENQQGYTFEAPEDVAGVLRIRHDESSDITIVGQSTGEDADVDDEPVDADVDDGSSDGSGASTGVHYCQ